MSIDISELESKRTDYRRANGAPQIVDRDGKNQRFSRPSSFAKPLDDESALVSWKLDRACIGVAGDRALQARWIAAASEGDNLREERATLREAAISAGRGMEAADIGTALHAMSVRWEKGEAGFEPPEPYWSSLVAYSTELRRLGLNSMLYEYHVVNEQYRCAGTADRLYELSFPLITPDGGVLPTGTLICGDLKTGGKLEYSKPAYAVQLCLYAEGDFYDVVEDRFITEPPLSEMRKAVNQDWAIIVHLPADEPGHCEMLWVDLEVGRWGCYLVDQIKRWRRSWRSGEFDMPHVMVQSDLVDAFDTGPDQSTAWGADDNTSFDPHPVEDDHLDSWVEWISLRLSYIAKHEGAKQRLLLLWPPGLPTPKQGIDDMGQVGTIIALLTKIEAEFSMGFVERPATLASTGSTHKKGR